MRRAAIAALLAFVFLASLLLPPAAAAPGPVEIAHTPPASAVPGQQIELQAVLRNASSASVTWNNGSLATPATVPMTNLSQAQGGGWAYAAWLPAQPDGAQVTYAIAATGPGGTASANFTLSVGAPPTTGMTAADQNAWVLTMAAVFSMAASTVVAAFYYTGLRLRRERS